ncbi:MAG: hypothetical protein ACJAZ2_001036 [Glaciecola sp.]|jgi:hypothetical protein
MRIAITYLFVMLLGTVHAQDFVVLTNNDTIKGQVRFNNLANSLSFVEVLQGDSALYFNKDTIATYQRGREEFISKSVVTNGIISKRMYKIEVYREFFSLYSYLVNGEIYYLIVNHKKNRELNVGSRKWEKSVSKFFRKKSELSLKIKRKEYAYKDMKKIVVNANNPNSTALTNKEVFGKRVIKVPIYKGEGEKKQINLSLSHQKGSLSKSDSGGNGEEYYEENEWFFYNIGLNTGMQYQNSEYFSKLVPAGLSLGYETDFAFFQRSFWVGWQYNSTLYPYLKTGNSFIRNKGFFSRLFIGDYFYFQAGYNWVRHKYNVYPKDAEIACSNVNHDGITDFETTLGAVQIFKSKTNSFQLGIGIHTKAEDTGIMFNHFQILFSQFKLTPQVNSVNFDFVNDSGRSLSLMPSNHKVWLISLKLGIRTWWEPY